MRRLTVFLLSCVHISYSFRPFSTSMKKFLHSSSSSDEILPSKRQRVDTTLPSVSSLSSVVDPVKVLTDSSHSILSAGDITQALNTAKSTNWITHSTIMYKFADRGSTNVDYTDLVTFDMDGTIITTKSGKTFAIGETDWKLWDNRIPKKLKELHDAGKYIALISNQNGVSANQTTPKAIQNKVDAILAHIHSVEPDIPIDFICAMDDDHFRKPRTGMLEFLVLARCPNVLKNTSIYVGDAAGREKEGTRAKDFSDTDLKMALNAGIEFQTPERFFYQSTQRLHTHLAIKDGLRLCDVNTPALDPLIFVGEGTKNEIVVMVAPPACGKSTISRQFTSKGYMRVNQDTLKTIDKCLSVARVHLSTGKSICVDNTNMDPNARAKWIQLGREFKVPVRCIVIKTTKEISKSLAQYRMMDPETTPEDKRKIGTIVFNMFFKEPMRWPTESEAFDRMDIVEWSPVLPSNPQSLRLFKMYLK